MTATAKKQTVSDEEGKVIKEMYFIVLTEGNDSLQLNVGQKTYEFVNKLKKQAAATAKK